MLVVDQVSFHKSKQVIQFVRENRKTNKFGVMKR